MIIECDDDDGWAEEGEEGDDEDRELSDEERNERNYWYERAKLDCAFHKAEDLAAVLSSYPRLDAVSMGELVYRASEERSAPCLRIMLDEVTRRELHCHAEIHDVIDSAINDLITASDDFDDWLRQTIEVIDLLIPWIKCTADRRQVIEAAVRRDEAVPQILCRLLEAYNPRNIVNSGLAWRKVFGVKQREMKPMLRWSGKRVARYIRARLVAQELEK